MTSSHWRIAAGSCLLVTVVMTNSGVAVAVADTGSSDSTKDAANSVSMASSVAGQTSPRPGAPDLLRQTLHDVTAFLGFDRQRGTHGYGGSSGSSSTADRDDPFAATAHITRTVTGLLDRRPSAAPTADAPAAPPITTLAIAPAGPVAPTVTPPPTPPIAYSPPAFDLTAPASAVVAAAQAVVAPVTAQIIAIPSLAVAPITDIVTSLQNVLSATGEAISPFVQFPTGLAALFPVTAGQPGVSTADSHLPTVTAAATTVAPPSLIQAMTQNAITGSTDGAKAVVTIPSAAPGLLDTAALAGASSVAATARTNPQHTISEGLQEFFQAYGTLIIAASLSALFGAALPGILGILIPTLAGMRLGYRQAKTGTTLQTSDIARFAGSGPVGIVRSGSLITFRPRASRQMPQHAELAPQQVA